MFQDSEPDAGATICPTGLYLETPDDCLPYGPSKIVSDLAQMGIPWPIPPLPAYPPDPALNDVPFRYFKVPPDGAYIYPSLGAAESDAPGGAMIGPGQLLYIAFKDRVVNDLGYFYYTQEGGWIKGREGGILAAPWPFQGLLFSSTPGNSFGWALGTIESRRGPGYAFPLTGRSYRTFSVVQVYATQHVEGLDWIMIAPDEWLEARHVGQVEPRYSPPEGVTAKRWIEINLYEQTLSVYENDRLVFATLVTTGADPFWTQPGVFSIYEKKDSEIMSGSFTADRSDYYYLEGVPWTMYFDGKRALHGAYWRTNFGYKGSHGCVNLSLGDSHWLYEWAQNGDTVYVFDPSGETPTDPSLYGAGAP